MKTHLRISTSLLAHVRKDLARQHDFAYERVGFIVCKAASFDGGLGLYAYEYAAVADADYIQNDLVGAMIGPAAFRMALEIAFNKGEQNVSIFHVHSHIGSGTPWFSRIDDSEMRKFVPDFFHAAPRMPHGALVLSRNEEAGAVWLSEDAKPAPIDSISSVGTSIKISRYE